MGVILDVPLRVLRDTERQWGMVADELDSNWRRLHRASTSDFSTVVAAAVDAFREPWVDLIRSASRHAQEYAADIAAYRADLSATDRDQGEALRALLPWTQRDAAITES